MDRNRRLVFALILAGLVLSMSPAGSTTAGRAHHGGAPVVAWTLPAPATAGLNASAPWRDRDAFLPVRRDNRAGQGRGPLVPLAVVAAIVAAALGLRPSRAAHLASLLLASSLRSRAPPAAALPLLP
jgi:hypothetical protein